MSLLNKLEKEGFSCSIFKELLPEGWISKANAALWGSLKNPQNPENSRISLEEFIELINNQIRLFKTRNRNRDRGIKNQIVLNLRKLVII